MKEVKHCILQQFPISQKKIETNTQNSITTVNKKNDFVVEHLSRI